MPNVVGGNNRYPSLQSIADLFRASINDSFAGATNTPGEGLIMFNQNPDLLTFMNAAIRDVFSDLRNVGDPALILDNYLLLNIPALTAQNPAVQTSLSYSGWFDGLTVSNQWTLPIGMERLLKVRERLASTGDFYPLTPAPNGLPSIMQGDCFNVYELRQNAIWFTGAMTNRDLNIRCRITFPDYLSPTTIDFTTSYVPILSCQNAVVAKMLVLYARRFAPDMFPIATKEDDKFMGKLQMEVIRAMQANENQRSEFGAEAVEDFAIAWSWL